jgi:HD-like signal output (HDOD) protein
VAAPAPVTFDSLDESPTGASSRPETSLSFEPRTLPTGRMETYRLAFSVSRLDDAVPLPHQAVLQRARGLRDEAVTQRRYFPRKPLLMPQLLRLMNDGHSSRRALTELIVQDPVLAGDVLKTANSSYYRVGGAPVESIDRSLAMLGTDGLRHVVASCILRPVFESGGACFPEFSIVMWDLAHRAGAAAAVFAGSTGNCERSAAQLVGLLTALGPLMLFRLVRDSYTMHEPALAPRAEVFIALLAESSAQSTREIAESWDLSPAFQRALHEQIDPSPDMTPLGRALYLGRYVAESALLIEHAKLDVEAVRETLTWQGLPSPVFDAMMADASVTAPAHEDALTA